jgi:hypothetical protein
MPIRTPIKKSAYKDAHKKDAYKDTHKNTARIDTLWVML